PHPCPHETTPLSPPRRRRWWKWILGTLGALVLLVALVGASLYHLVLGGYREDSFEYAGVRRTFGYVLPRRYDPSQASPLVLLLHGAGMNAKTMAILANLDVRPRADAEHAILIYPEALEGLWNDGMGAVQPRTNPAPDSAFIAALIDRFVSERNGDSNRVYLLGVSNGAALGYRLACEHPRRFAALACFIGGMSSPWIQQATNLPPVPIRIVNSTRDPFVRWEGGPVVFGDDPPLAILASVEENVAYWTNRNRAGPIPRITPRPNPSTEDHSQVTEYEYSGDAEVVVVKVEGADHSVPTPHFRPWNGPGTNRDIEAVPEALEFLFRFHQAPNGNVRRGIP
ncbi:MAG: alpha/beta fold hydrolase, partial [Verrucomicrobiales bacterium]|nr:alpha/beta fold hydrolase [Verrucomicrobiales bacterium]